MSKKDIMAGLLIALFLAIFISPFASSFPDGLERVAENKNFIEIGEGKPTLNAPIPDYIWPKIANDRIATSIAGVVGTIAVFLATFGIGYIFKKK